MLRLVVLVLLGVCLSLTLAYPAVTTASVPRPTKYAACKESDCPPFRVVERFTDSVELREYSRVWWASAKGQAPRISRNVTSPLYWLLRKYIWRSKRSLCNNGKCQKSQLIKMGVPVTRLVESTNGMKAVTVSFYLSGSSPPRPTDNRVWLEYRSPLLVYVKIVKGIPFKRSLGVGDAYDLAEELIGKGVDDTEFYPPCDKYMTAGYDGPSVPREERTNEVWLIKRPVSNN